MLGQVPEAGAERDAVHVAILPCESESTLYPGQDVGVKDGMAATDIKPYIGKVDPFVAGPVFPGTRFYVCLYPNTVTGMRHHWRLPAIDEPEVDYRELTKDEAQEWVTEFAEKNMQA